MRPSVRPLTLGALPRVSRATAEASRTVARALAGVPPVLTSSIRGLGAVTVTIHRLDVSPSPPPRGESLEIAVDGVTGRLWIDTSASLALSAAILGAPASSILRPLGPVERGVLAAAVAGFVEGLPDAPALTVGLGGHPTGEVDVSLHGTVRAPGLSGAVRLDAPLSFFGRRRGSLKSRGALAVPVSVAVAASLFPQTQLGCAEPGDALLFEGVSARAALAGAVELRIGPLVGEASLDADGTLALTGAFSTPLEEEEPMQRDKSDRRSDSPDTLTDLPRAIADAPVEVVAEIGRLSLRLDELSGLLAGGVIALGRLRPDAVALRVGGSLWARGELVDVDGELGVRLTEIVSGR